MTSVSNDSGHAGREAGSHNVNGRRQANDADTFRRVRWDKRESARATQQACSAGARSTSGDRTQAENEQGTLGFTAGRARLSRVAPANSQWLRGLLLDAAVVVAEVHLHFCPRVEDRAREGLSGGAATALVPRVAERFPCCRQCNARLRTWAVQPGLLEGCVWDRSDGATDRAHVSREPAWSWAHSRATIAAARNYNGTWVLKGCGPSGASQGGNDTCGQKTCQRGRFSPSTPALRCGFTLEGPLTHYARLFS